MAAPIDLHRAMDTARHAVLAASAASLHYWRKDVVVDMKPDRRRVLVALTAGGRRVMAGLSAAHREELRQLGPRLRAALEAVTLPTLGGRAASQGAREVS